MELLINDELESPKIVKILKVTKENEDVKTITFKDIGTSFPGQFVMIWLPGVDEVPMSLSYIGSEKGITVKRVGLATEAMHKLKSGDSIGVRGPYGTNFEANGKKLLVVAGGIGIAPLAPLIELAREKGKQIHLAIGAKTSTELLFLNRLKDCCDLNIATDDGSYGYHGFVTDMVEEILKKESYDEIMTCGPEIMIKRVVDMANKSDLRVQASLERYMKCGVGICDSCAINGLLVCKDGPIFSGDTLNKLKDFGKIRRDACGRVEQV
ncbi:MAG: dihydroorotate dehydrogenase electron transfer subunit [Thermoplasmata archaeon]|nr:MAG: dihydroorotate dehydrogenase electron transfer subunit [Thermoplasmata archaeon]